MTSEQKITCAMAVLTFGQLNQKHIAIEELSELIKEITKDLRDMPNKDHIMEEMADVEIMLYQLKHIYMIQQDEYEKMLNSKVERLDNLIKQEEAIKTLERIIR